METRNPFKELESETVCPPQLKTELVAEIDLIRNAVSVVELYVGAILSIATVLVIHPYQPWKKNPPS